MASSMSRMLLKRVPATCSDSFSGFLVSNTSKRVGFRSVVVNAPPAEGNIHVRSFSSALAHHYAVTCDYSCCRRRNLSTGNDKSSDDDDQLDPTLANATIISPQDAKLAMEASSTTDSGSTNLPGTGGKSGQNQLAIVFTCTKCNTRSAKQFTEQAYRHGVVLVRCPGCQGLHLIADRLGVFEDQGEDGQGWDIEKAMTNLGDNVKAVNNDNVLQLTLQDVVGEEKMDEVVDGNGDDPEKRR